MSFAGKLARGLLSGAAAYEGKLAETAEFDRRANILAQREIALKGAEAQAQAARDRQKHIDDVDLATQSANAQAAARVREVTQTEPVKTASTIAVERNKALTDYNIWLKKQPVELQNKLTFEDFVQDRQDSRNATNQAEETKREGIRQDRQDARSPPSGGDTQAARDARAKSMFEDGLAQWNTAGRPAGKRPQLKDYYSASDAHVPSTGAPASTSVATDAKTYTMADLQFTAQKAGISVDEARKRLNGAGFRLTN